MAGVARRKCPKTGRVLPDSVSYRKNDDRYIYKYVYAGKTKYLYAKDLTTMKKKIEELNANLFRGINLDYQEIKLNDYYAYWLEVYKKDKLKQTGYNNLEDYYDWYVKDYPLGHMKIRDINRRLIIEHFNLLVKEKDLARGTLRLIESMLFLCLKSIVRDNGLTYNPVDDILEEISCKEEKETFSLTKEQKDLLLEFISIEDKWWSIYRPIIGVLIGTGARYGEIVGLRWCDVSLEEKEIDINHIVQYKRKKGKKHEYFASLPKTKAAIRRIPISDDIVMLFREQKEYLQNMKIRKDFDIDGYHDFIFVSKLGKPFTNEGITNTLNRIVSKANEWECERAQKEGREPVEIPKLHLHVFRHTYITNSVATGVRPEVLQKLVGHAKYETTLKYYTHLDINNCPEMRSEAEKAGKLF